MKRLIPIILLLLAAPVLRAQPDSKEADAHTANEKFIVGNYEEALDDYLSLLEKEPKSDKYNYRVAVCYLNTNINKTKAIPYLEIVTRQPKADPDAMFLLGRAYQFAYRFDDAVKCYNSFKSDGKGSAENLADVDREIQNCYNAKELMKYPLNVNFENLGSSINSAYADYYPFVPSDESFLVFSTKRPDGGVLRQPDGSYFSSVYLSRVQGGSYQKAKNIGAPISSDDKNVEVIGLSGDGDDLLLFYTDPNTNLGTGDIYLSQLDKAKNYFKKPEELDDNVNSSKGDEIAAAIAADGNTIYFASNRAGGYGGIDLYSARRLPTGKWGTPQNLGPEINTAFDEDFPSLSPDGTTFYFSSKGHTSLGGYDIFKADWNDSLKKYSGVKNMGYPINTPEDNSNFRISQDGRYGYISALRDGGLGDLDIYRVTFNDVEPRYSVIRGQVAASDKSKTISYSDVFITVTDKNSGEVVGNYVPNANSGRYVIIVPPGVYEVTYTAPGFTDLHDTLNILDKSSFRTEIDKDVTFN